MGSSPSGPTGESPVCRCCTRCGQVLQVTPDDALVCRRCGPARAWTVRVNGTVVGAGREANHGGVGIWLAGRLDDLRPAPAREPARSCRGWNEEG